MTDTIELPRYDPAQTYASNYDRAPEPIDVQPTPVSGPWSFCGLPVDSPLGLPAGPLLNGGWLLYYASLGFDTLTYKTVRSVARDCYSLPNLVPVVTGPLCGGETDLPACGQMQGSWAVSFGMPSKSPDVWRKDIEGTRRQLPPGKVLCVSVVGTIQPGRTIDDLADDYARCARWAAESGADAVETNFSCPNVDTCDGQLYQDVESGRLVAARVKDVLGNVPYLIKIGHMNDIEQARILLDAVAPFVRGLSMTNSVAATVRAGDGKLYFDGHERGICGDATRMASLAQTRLFADEISRRGLNIDVVGVGGASTVEHVRQYLAAGATNVQIATAAMIDPGVALKIRTQLTTADMNHVET